MSKLFYRDVNKDEYYLYYNRYRSYVLLDQGSDVNKFDTIILEATFPTAVPKLFKTITDIDKLPDGQLIVSIK